MSSTLEESIRSHVDGYRKAVESGFGDESAHLEAAVMNIRKDIVAVHDDGEYRLNIIQWLFVERLTQTIDWLWFGTGREPSYFADDSLEAIEGFSADKSRILDLIELSFSSNHGTSGDTACAPIHGAITMPEGMIAA